MLTKSYLDKHIEENKLSVKTNIYLSQKNYDKVVRLHQHSGLSRSAVINELIQKTTDIHDGNMNQRTKFYIIQDLRRQVVKQEKELLELGTHIGNSENRLWELVEQIQDKKEKIEMIEKRDK